MTERDIFFAATEIADPAERSAYLEQVCAGNPSQKQDVERLLQVYPHLGRFLESPAVALDNVAGSPMRAGSFQLGPELARGGMGVVYCARDESLGRDVAVKVLHERYLIDSLVGQRFLDESRITAQLQHPGIPPVFEVGRLANNRPYLAMKLIKGRTLEDLLKERAEPTNDRGHFVAVFLQICQAVGYAHSRHILHRDLKPANVMVGAFGEVQVMDWGLAKLIQPGGTAARKLDDTNTTGGTIIQSAREPDSSTLVGSMLGTPAFMAPEQAGGDLDRIDERTDVFGLGAILCVILTGQPPYTAKSDAELQLMAVRGTLTDAHARLDQCGADGKLVDLCRQCLSREPEARPPDAGAVAASVAGYLAGVEERMRQAQRERAAAEARAAEQRKRRRVQLALAATVLVLFGVVGFGLWWQERNVATAAARRAERESRVSAGVVEALHEMRQRAEEAWKLPEFPDRMQVATEKALAALRRADDMASDGAPDEASRDLASAHCEADVLLRHTRLIQKWSNAGTQFANEATGQGWSEPLQQYSSNMEAAFKEIGLDPLHDPVEGVANEIVSSRFRDLFLDYIDGWHWHNHHERLEQLIRLVRLKSGGAFAHWQQLLDARDVQGLVSFAASPEALSFPTALINGLARHLRDARQFGACRSLLRDAAERCPNCEWVHFDLAGICLVMDPPDYAEALRHSSAAALLRPDSAAFQLRLGNCYAGLASYDRAAACYRRCIELGHGAVVGYVQLGNALAKQKDWDGAIAAVREAISRQPNYWPAYTRLAGILQGAGRNVEGLKALVDAIHEHPDLATEPRYFLRYNAACLAMNCADGLGVNPPSQAERPSYRQQALTFLTAELTAVHELAAKSPAEAHKEMEIWLADKDLASVRDSTAVGRLSSDERDAWNKLWSEVRALRDQTAPRSTVSP